MRNCEVDKNTKNFGVSWPISGYIGEKFKTEEEAERYITNDIKKCWEYNDKCYEDEENKKITLKEYINRIYDSEIGGPLIFDLDKYYFEEN